MTDKAGKFKEDFYNLNTEQAPLAEGFLYKHKVHMLYADPGAGKSTITQQLALELAAGKPVFKVLDVPHPMKVYYIQLEGDLAESIERMRLMSGFGTEGFVEPNFDNLYWDRDHVGLNVIDQTQVTRLINDIMEIMPEPDLIIIDPIYQAIVGDLSKPEVPMAYCRFSAFIRNIFNCAILHVHHTPKESADKNGDIIKRQTFYGSQWFAAHMNSMYYLDAVNKKTGKTVLYNKKQRNSNMLPEIQLSYDVETHSVYIEQDEKKMDGRERFMHFINESKKQDRWVSIYDIMEETLLACSYCRNLIGNLKKNKVLGERISNKGKKMYQILGPI